MEENKMNLKKIIGKSICALTLGTVITGMSVTATEINNVGSERNQVSNVEQNEEDSIYDKEYKRLTSFYNFD